MKFPIKITGFVLGAALAFGGFGTPMAKAGKNKKYKNHATRTVRRSPGNGKTSRSIKRRFNPKPGIKTTNDRRKTPSHSLNRKTGKQKGSVPGGKKSHAPRKNSKAPSKRAIKPHIKQRVVAPQIKRGGIPYKQKLVVRNNRTLVERRRVHIRGPVTRARVRYYLPHHWRHRHYHVYVRYWTYDPWFWGFYFAPFPTPWVYTWGWSSAHWYVTWGWYFHPYPAYIGPSYWVTDYVISRSLEAEYDRGYADGKRDAEQAAQQETGTAISEPVKEQLRKQVDDTAKSFKEDKSVLLEQVLQKPDYLFVVDTPISVTTADKQTCLLTSGDIIKPTGQNTLSTGVATMVVVTSKNQKCAAGSQISASLSDLQEMLNSFSEKVDDGMNELQKKREQKNSQP